MTGVYSFLWVQKFHFLSHLFAISYLQILACFLALSYLVKTFCNIDWGNNGCGNIYKRLSVLWACSRNTDEGLYHSFCYNIKYFMNSSFIFNSTICCGIFVVIIYYKPFNSHICLVIVVAAAFKCSVM